MLLALGKYLLSPVKLTAIVWLPAAKPTMMYLPVPLVIVALPTLTLSRYTSTVPVISLFKVITALPFTSMK